MPSHTLPALPPGFQLIQSTQLASLWSNYGYIYRLQLSSVPTSLVLKSIHPPVLNHPSESHVRKMLSYEVERWFYLHLVSQLPPHVKVAHVYALPEDQQHNLLLEDLSVEFPYPAFGSLDRDATVCVLSWLAGFHGTFFRIHHRGKTLPIVPPPNTWKEGATTDGIWQRGTYYYLDTRREELAETDEEEYAWLFPWIEKVNRSNNIRGCLSLDAYAYR